MAQGVGAAGVEAGDDAAAGVHYAGDVGEEDDLGGAQGAGEGAGGGVAVDIQGVAGVVGVWGDVGGERGNHRDVAGGEDGVDRGGVDGGDFADIAQLGVGDAGLEEAAVGAADADGGGAEVLHMGGQLLVDQAGEDGDDDVQGGGVGDAESVDEVGGEVLAAHPFADEVAAAVDDGHGPGGGVEGGEVAEGGIAGAEGAAADFDYDGRFGGGWGHDGIPCHRVRRGGEVGADEVAPLPPAPLITARWCRRC